ncbi:Malectin/receptor-like protein kinase family protein [Perilla frutescens var. hirtella]|uniref:Malectin/receptor-like protein kinase family protein n=1 Tax=Perilla frutescens var. hirtella TaxID=608512 RepID=A0AAD4NWU3_PERFH|nr:Malectin/receptor-like protein kinase family protein [Perilla frutescens var. hirtella]
MEETPPRRLRPSPLPILLVLLVLSLSPYAVVAAPINAPANSDAFTPPDNYLFDCGNPSSTTAPGNRVFVGDPETGKYLSYSGRNIQAAAPQPDPTVPSPIYNTASVFESSATYTFHVTRPGWHWIRLHFSPVQNNLQKDLKTAKFRVTTSSSIVLVQEFEMPPNTTWSMREFLVNVTTERFSVTFSPVEGSLAFINAIEFVSAPDILLGDVASSVFPKGSYPGMTSVAYQTAYRLNSGGPAITPENDTLGRNWYPDQPYLDPKFMGSVVTVKPNVITYPQGESPLIAPPFVYATATQMADANVQVPSFNITWRMKVDTSFQYFIRLHFADIVSKSVNDLYFNVYINGRPAITGLDLSTVAGGLSAAYFADFVLNSTMVAAGLDPLTVQVGPMNENAGTKNALLNGIEVFKMNNSVGSLDGEFGVNGERLGGNAVNGTVAAVGFAMMFGAFIGLGAMAVKWKKRPQDWQKKNSFSSWLLPIHAGDASFLSGSKTSLGSRKSQVFSSTMGLGRYFSFAELQEATNNWESSAIIGVGGFGNVYLGVIDDGIKVAVKRGNPQSEQGINEFQTEIQILSKLRHRHLVSLIGYCDENAEMILVYEFMANGPVRDHLYGNVGKALPTLSWKQRLEICIGAARGLHYLHTGAAQGIIHRDVKTTNILLDENFVAKMADFGLSKDAPGAEQTHVSTAVKGSFGYLDPEYFRKQQLTDKSDVYSFGVVLLEALCARPAINPALPREQVNLAEWAMQWKRKGLLDKIIDPTLVGHISPESMNKFGEAAEKCLSEYGVDRPTMGDVLWNLEYALQMQESWSQEKGDDDFAAPSSPRVDECPPAQSAVESKPSTAIEEEAKPLTATAGEAQAIEEHSGTAMFAQFAALNGR